MHLKFTVIAHHDLEQIWEYIAQENPAKASQVTQILWQKCQLLADNPLIGRKREELVQGLRSFPVKNYLIFYRINAQQLEIIRILNAIRDIKHLFNP